MDWLTSAVIATLLGSLILTFTYKFLFAQEKQRFLLIWNISWLINSFHFLFVLSSFRIGDQAWLTIGNHTSSLESGVFLLWGAYEFSDRRYPKWWWGGAAAGCTWISLAVLNQASVLITTLPSFTFLAGVYIWTGKTITNTSHSEGQSKYLTGRALFFWGIHKADFSFVRTVAWIAPWGYILGGVFEFVVAIGMKNWSSVSMNGPRIWPRPIRN